MAITNLQQARQMFRYGGDTMGGPNDKSNNNNNNNNGSDHDHSRFDSSYYGGPTKSTDTSPDNRDIAIANMYTNLPTPTVTLGVDKFDNPIKVNTTYTAKRNRQQMLNALNAKGISSFDPRLTKKGFNFLDPNNLMTGFVSQPKRKFSFVRDILIPAGLTAINPALAAKYSKAKMAYKTVKTLADVAQTIGLTDKNVVDSFTSNLSNFGNFGKKNKTKTVKTNIKNTRNKDDNKGGDGNGIASLENQAGNYDEYILLLQKLQSGNISDAERNRYNVLKNMLGI